MQSPASIISLSERFADSYIVDSTSGCWNWTGTLRKNTTKPPRPILYTNTERVYAHRLAYELFKGPIPPNALICHKCDNTLCVNPEHLYAGDYLSNVRDMIERNRHGATRFPDKFKAIGARLGKSRIGVRYHQHFPKIPHADFTSIMQRRSAGEKLASIASSYGVTKSAICTFIKTKIQEESSMKTATIFLNVHSFGGKEYCEGEVMRTRQEAIREAEEWSDRYSYTLTDHGIIDLRDEFSERYQRTRGYDELMDARIDALKDGRA